MSQILILWHKMPFGKDGYIRSKNMNVEFLFCVAVKAMSKPFYVTDSYLPDVFDGNSEEEMTKEV